jgi:xylulokinase
MAERFILSVDLGTSGAKTALISTHGRVVGWEYQEVPLYVFPDGGAEQAPEDWWQAIFNTSRKLISRKIVPAEDIVAFCCSTQGEGTVPVDRDGKPLMNAVLWMDMRGKSDIRKMAGGPVKVAGYGLLKVLQWMKLTGGAPSLTGKDPSGHMLYIKHRHPEIFEKTYKFLNVLDYINLRLTGRFCATSDSILTSWVTDNRNPEEIKYHPGLIKRSQINAEKFPELVRCIDVIGVMKPDVAAEMGLKHEVKVVAGAIDNTSSAIGSGAVEDYVPHLYIGTSSWITAHVPFKKTDLSSFLASTPCAIPDKYLLTALQATAGGNLTFLKEKILYHKDELLQEENVPNVYQVMDIIAERVPAGSNGVIYTPWIWGERAPVDDPCIRAAVHNLSLDNSREDLIRAFLEGVALNTRWLVEPVEKFIGRKIEVMNFVGGGANSNIWSQILADVMNITIRQVKDPIQANARGAAFMAAVGLGEITFEDIPGLVEYNRIYEPNPIHRVVYDDIFAEFVNIYHQNKGIYKRLNGKKMQ